MKRSSRKVIFLGKRNDPLEALTVTVRIKLNGQVHVGHWASDPEVAGSNPNSAKNEKSDPKMPKKDFWMA